MQYPEYDLLNRAHPRVIALMKTTELLGNDIASYFKIDPIFRNCTREELYDKLEDVYNQIENNSESSKLQQLREDEFIIRRLIIEMPLTYAKYEMPKIYNNCWW